MTRNKKKYISSNIINKIHICHHIVYVHTLFFRWMNNKNIKKLLDYVFFLNIYGYIKKYIANKNKKEHSNKIKWIYVNTLFEYTRTTIRLFSGDRSEYITTVSWGVCVIYLFYLIDIVSTNIRKLPSTFQ